MSIGTLINDGEFRDIGTQQASKRKKKNRENEQNK